MAAGAILLGGAAACGSSGGSGGASTIRFGVVSPNADLTPLYVAADQGFFKKAGLNVEITNFTGGGASSSAALASGAVDVASGGPGSFLGSIAKKAISGKIFAQLVDQSYDVVATKGITDMAALKGRSIGVSGINSNDHMYLTAVLAHYGISPHDVTFLNTGTPSNRYAALSSGKIQATAEPDSQRTASEGVGKVLLEATKSPVRAPGQVFYAEGDYLKAHAKTLKTFMSVMYKTVAWVKDPKNQKAAVASCAKGSGTAAKVCAEVIGFSGDPSKAGPYTWSSTFAVNPAGMRQSINAAATLIPEAKSLTVGNVVDSSITGTKP
jgi:NitT/TauT family transport system substrate-binding protein